MFLYGCDHHSSSLDLSQSFHLFEIEWSSSEVVISVDGQPIRRISGAGRVPQMPLSVYLHARSIDYPNMLAPNKSMYVSEFWFEPAVD